MSVMLNDSELRATTPRIQLPEPTADLPLSAVLNAYVRELTDRLASSEDLALQRAYLSDLHAVARVHDAAFAAAEAAVFNQAGWQPGVPHPEWNLRKTEPGTESGQLMLVHERFEVLRERTSLKVIELRNRAIAETLADPPAWLTNTLGSEPSEGVHREVWQTTSERLACYRLTMGIEDPDQHGVPRTQRTLLSHLADARIELGLEHPAVDPASELT